MRSNQGALEAKIRRGLESWTETALPDDVNLWPIVASRLAQPGHPASNERLRAKRETVRQTVVAIFASALLAMGGVAVAAAASPSVRSALHHLWPLFDSGPVSQGISTGGRPLYMSPTPHFHVYYPTDIPPWMVIRGTGHVLPGGFRNRSPMPFDTSFVCPGNVSPRSCGGPNATLQQIFPPAPSGAPFLPSVVSPLVQKGIEAVWFGFHASLPARDYVSVAEWDARQYPVQSTGKDLAINNAPSRLDRHGGRTTLTQIRGGSAIVAQTNLGRAAAIKFLASQRLSAVKPKR